MLASWLWLSNTGTLPSQGKQGFINVETDEGSDQSAAWLVFNMFNKDDKREHYKIQNNKCEKPKQSYLVHRHKDRRQETTSHKTQHKTGYLNRVPNQRQ